MSDEYFYCIQELCTIYYVLYECLISNQLEKSPNVRKN